MTNIMARFARGIISGEYSLGLVRNHISLTTYIHFLESESQGCNNQSPARSVFLELVSDQTGSLVSL